MVLIVFLIFFIIFCYGMEWSFLFFVMIVLIVVMILEGLFVVLMMILLMGVYEMVRENVIIKGMFFVEILGLMIVICLDKIGMLIKNEMMVMDVVIEEMIIVKEIMVNC